MYANFRVICCPLYSDTKERASAPLSGFACVGRSRSVGYMQPPQPVLFGCGGGCGVGWFGVCWWVWVVPRWWVVRVVGLFPVGGGVVVPVRYALNDEPVCTNTNKFAYYKEKSKKVAKII